MDVATSNIDHISKMVKSVAGERRHFSHDLLPIGKGSLPHELSNSQWEQKSKGWFVVIKYQCIRFLVFWLVSEYLFRAAAVGSSSYYNKAGFHHCPHQQ